MTREEAIDLLDNLLGMVTDNHEADYDEAIKMAIQALSQESKILNTIDFAIDASNGNTNYFVGFRNGLRYAKSLIDGEEPQFESCAEQEPCTDAISREAFITRYREWMKSEYGKIPDDDTLAIRVIKSLPPVTQKPGKWIPVSERLPEDAYGCLVTVEIDNVSMSECVQTILNYWVGYDGETWNNSDGIPIPYEVIAWMPLPKPYEPQESEE